MRAWLCNVIVIGALALASCAPEEESQQRQPLQPLPPRHPALEGNIKSASSAEIRQILDLVRKHINKTYGSALPIYRVYVLNSSHVNVSYWAKGLQNVAYVERVNGKWKVTDTLIERAIITGRNIPTG